MTVTVKTVRGIALPSEHGAWNLWLEPVLLALIIAPSTTGFAILCLSFFALLIRQPLKVALIDLSRRRIYTRTRLSVAFTCVYLLFGILTLIVILSSDSKSAVYPLLPALIMAVVVIFKFDLYGKSRDLTAELLAAVLMSAFAVSICLAAEWPLDSSLAAAGVVIARSVPAIVYVRVRLQQIKQNSGNARVPLGMHLAALAMILVLVWLELAPAAAVIASLLLLVRATYNLRFPAVSKAQVVGMQEVIYGMIYAAIVAAGFLVPR